MNDVTPVRVVQRVCHFGGNADRLLDPELCFAVQFVPKRLTVDEWHHVVREAICLAGVE
jgi:hypothetical protein